VQADTITINLGTDTLSGTNFRRAAFLVRNLFKKGVGTIAPVARHTQSQHLIAKFDLCAHPRVRVVSLRRCARQDEMMSFKLAVSKRSPESSRPYELSSGDGLPKRSPTMYLINPGQNIPDHGTRGSISPVSQNVEEMECNLHEARNNFAAIFNASLEMLCIIRLNGLRYLEINNSYERHTGYSRGEVLGRPSLKLGLWKNAEDRKRTIHKLLTKGCLRGQKAVFSTKTGERLTAFLSAEIIEFGGEPCALVIAEDITIRRQAEEARRDLAQRLISAQEAERTRIARELHDNIGQSLALLNMELERTRLTLSDVSIDSDAGLVRLGGKLKELGRVVGSLSHRLHSSTLEMLGLVVAAKALCQEFADQYLVPTQCDCFGVLDNLSADVSLCLFRVMQEALRNIAKHGHAKKVDVELIGTLNKIHLNISDDGVGFTPNEKNTRPGLGLISMRERLNLVGGKFAIVSKPGSGTRVEATVPLYR
jgi:PAS domain S-box-containing protein